MKPIVSVIMPAYNSEKFIASAIDSVLAQTFRDFELIIIDDGSTDATKSIIESFVETERRIVFLQNKKNSGVSFTRNFGISQARGEWIAFLDSDDMWRNDKLEKQINLIRSCPDALLTYTASSFVDFSGRPYSFILDAESELTYNKILKRNLLSCSSVIVRKDIISHIKMAGDKMHEDYAAWMLILREIRCAYGINEPLLIYRLSAHSKSGKRFRSAMMNYNSYRYVGYNVVQSILLMLRYSVHSIKKHLLIKIM